MAPSEDDAIWVTPDKELIGRGVEDGGGQRDSRTEVPEPLLPQLQTCPLPVTAKAAYASAVSCLMVPSLAVSTGWSPVSLRVLLPSAPYSPKPSDQPRLPPTTRQLFSGPAPIEVTLGGNRSCSGTALPGVCGGHIHQIG